MKGDDSTIYPVSSQPPWPVYAVLVGVMERAAGRLQLPWLLFGGEIDHGESVFSPGHRTTSSDEPFISFPISY